MPRRPRLHVPGGLYHVILRGNARGDIFFDTDDRLRWESILAEELERHGHRIHAYCWMTNHIHVAIQCGRKPLSGFMAGLSSRYAKSTNRKFARSGHLFERRYTPFLVQADSYLRELIRYIHQNPVRAGLTLDLAAYRWSSHSSYLGGSCPDWLTVDWVLHFFGNTELIARAAYTDFMQKDQQDSMLELFRKGGQTDDRVLGNDDFLESVTGPSAVPNAELNLEQIVDATCAKYGVDKENLRSASRDRKFARIRAEIGSRARENGTATVQEIASYFGRSHAAISRAITKFAKEMKTGK